MCALRHILATAALTALVAGAPIFPATAQDVRYATVSKLELGGSLGRVMRLVPGLGDPIRETLSISGTRMRTDGDDQATIMNADDGTITYLDHETKTFWTMDVAEMLAGLGQAFAGLDRAVVAAEVEAEAEVEADAAPTADSVHYEIHISTDRTGRTEHVAGYPAEQVFVTVEIEGEAYSEEGDSTVRGSMYVLSELWLSEEFPGHQAEQAFREAWAARLSEAYQLPEEDARNMEAVFAHDPRLREGLEQMEAEMRELRGAILRSVLHFVVVPDGVEFDREAVLRDADRSLAADVGQAVVRGALAGARRRLGRFGRRNREPEKPKPQQAVVMRIKTEIEDVDVGALADELFEPPPDYTEQPAPGTAPQREGN